MIAWTPVITAARILTAPGRTFIAVVVAGARGRPAEEGCARRSHPARSRVYLRGKEARRGNVCLPHAEDGLAQRPHIDDLPGLELERLGGLARELRREPLAVVTDELRANLETEMRDPLDQRLAGRSIRVEQDLDVVWPDECTAEPVDGADEAHHELVRRV